MDKLGPSVSKVVWYWKLGILTTVDYLN